MRAPFQILILPYKKINNKFEYAIFKRSDAHYWQGIAGGGEDEETPMEAAKRELFEETGIKDSNHLHPLQFKAYVPVLEFEAHKYWPKDMFVIPEHYFSVQIKNEKIKLSREHIEYRWVEYKTAYQMIHWQSNKNGLWELNERLSVSSVERGNPVISNSNKI